MATNPFALIFLLPSLHAWLWLPHVRPRPIWTRLAVLGAGFLGPLLLLASLAVRYGLGLDAPWYLAELAATGYVGLPALAIAVGWLAAAGQMSALTIGRYAPYPSARERPPRGPFREAVRRARAYSESCAETTVDERTKGAGGMTTGRVARITGTLMLAAGVAVLVWVLVVWRWQDPFTALYTTWKQHQLSQSYEKRAQVFRLPDPKSKAAAAPGVTAAQIRAQARRYRLASKRGQAIGRLRVPRLGLNMVVVDGTDHDSLTKGPGLDRRTYMPGEGQLVYIAGHRTTYLAPFAHIERMKAGDPISLEVPYGTFRYRVFTHRIVTADDLAVLKSRGREIVELQACHPRFFASHRYIVYARLMQIDPRGAPPIRAPARTLAAAPLASTQG